MEFQQFRCGDLPRLQRCKHGTCGCESVEGWHRVGHGLFLLSVGHQGWL